MTLPHRSSALTAGFRSTASLKRVAATIVAGAMVAVLSACGPSDPNIRPTDSQLKDAISLLLKNFQSKHPALVTWKIDQVNKQLSASLPKGFSTEAGFHLMWTSYSDGQLPEVYIPWDLIGQYPNSFQKEVTAYSSHLGKPVPSSVAQVIRRDQLKNQADDSYFAAVVGMRYSVKDPRWIIFTTIPYLPVTDPAYGWATATSGSWKVSDFGTATVGCGKVPTPVQHEFGYDCPSR